MLSPRRGTACRARAVDVARFFKAEAFARPSARHSPRTCHPDRGASQPTRDLLFVCSAGVPPALFYRRLIPPCRVRARVHSLPRSGIYSSFTLVVQSTRECDRQESGYPRRSSRLSRDPSAGPGSIRLPRRRRNTRGLPAGLSHCHARISGRCARRGERPFARPLLDARSDRRMYRRAVPKPFARP